MAKPTPKNPVIQPTQTRSRVTFETILEATTYLIEEKGIHSITTNKIADRAGVNINSVYQYFLNKNSILQVITERFADESKAEMRKSLLRSQNMKQKERALTIIGDILEKISQRPDLHREILLNMPFIIGSQKQETFHNELSGNLVDVMPEELYPSEKSRKLASKMLVHTFLNGATPTLSPTMPAIERKLMSDELRHMILRYIGVNELSPRNYKDYFFYIPSANHDQAH